jgi:hypothetical protein
MTLLLEDIVSRMALIVRLPMEIMILDRQFMILRKFRYEYGYRGMSSVWTLTVYKLYINISIYYLKRANLNCGIIVAKDILSYGFVVLKVMSHYQSSFLFASAPLKKRNCMS